ncbi:MAG: glycoside hydrolase family 3 C-terminal domain-containing protein [Lentisphaerota bacterium]
MMTNASPEMELYRNPSQPVEQRVEDLLKRMTLEEKVDQVSGATCMDTRRNERLGIPALRMSDGPHGVRWEKATCFPTAIGLGASWNTNLVERIGIALADEARAKGRNILLGPCVNIHRTPLGGRNFESFSEDPYHAGRMAVAYVRGVQGRKIGTSTKHYAVNNQEWERTTINVKVDERTLHELYLPAFKAAVQEAGTWTVMAAYNRLNGPYCCANRILLTEVLKERFGFQGLVMSDWGACHGTVDSANAGLDLEMPGPGQFFGAALLDAVKKGEVCEATLDDKVRRILRVMFQMGLFDGIEEKEKGALDTPEHRQLAREAGAEGVVLLKNDGNILPLKREAIRSIAVVGPNAGTARLGGGGSSSVEPFYSISPLQGLQEKAGSGISVAFVQGCLVPGELKPIPTEFLVPPKGCSEPHGLKAEYFTNKDLAGEPALTRIDPSIDFNWGDGSPAPEIPTDGFSARWTGQLIPDKSGLFQVGLTSDDGFRLYLDGKLVIDQWVDQAGITTTADVKLKAGIAHDLRVEYYENIGGAQARMGWVIPQEGSREEAVRVAGESDVVIVFAGISSYQEGEGVDRNNLDLPGDQNDLIADMVAANSNTIVVLNNGAPLNLSPWLGKVPAVVEAWYPGQEGGRAVADVLFGEVNPSGKLPMTFPLKLEDLAAQKNYPGSHGEVRYEEGLMVGYRFHDTRNVEPLFPFGHGLSYTRFEYDGLSIDSEKTRAGGPVEVVFSLSNAGPVAGAEVAQIYVRDLQPCVERPFKELKAFKKVFLQPGEKTELRFALKREAFAFYDVQTHGWLAPPGRYEVLIGSSSKDVRLQGELDLH